MSSHASSSPATVSLFEGQKLDSGIITPLSSLDSFDLNLGGEECKSDQQRCSPKPETEFGRIQDKCPILATTGCTKNFCQAGRAIHTFEPRVGRDRPATELRDEARAFLQQCRMGGILKNDMELETRTSQAIGQIVEVSSNRTLVTHEGHRQLGHAGTNWQQSKAEVEYGLRLAWKNSRKCIMRSEYTSLSMCDLRQVKTSREMAESLVSNLVRAYNNGKIEPTVFVFPPREPGKRGPMIWNEQLLAFAGYRNEDGSVLGDPKNVEITEAIRSLGWRAPVHSERTPWDILPLVTMAEDDVPYVLELPAEIKKVVSISHPRYESEFRELNLKWVAFPALSRLGFDIGGIQYTAAPFIGWFMDAEIGVRNLADTFRYNALPRIVGALRLSDDPDVNFEDLAEYKRLAALSRAQAELTYAVHHSFLKAKISMTDTLTASLKWCQFDDEHLQQNGYRLPADPYWLAPPQGSIIPLWHRGGAPNYQPKPVICRHVQDPVKAWRRQTMKPRDSSPASLCPFSSPKARPAIINNNRGSIGIYYCSSGVTAAKLSAKLYENLCTFLKEANLEQEILRPRPLNKLDINNVAANDFIFIIASSTGRGEIPANGQRFLSYSHSIRHERQARFSVYGNGDSTYTDTFNFAAIKIRETLSKLGFLAAGLNFFEGDTATTNPDWNSFYSWTNMLRQVLLRKEQNISFEATLTKRSREAGVKYLPECRLVRKSQVLEGIMHITIDVGPVKYSEMDHIKIIPPNPKSEVQRAMEYLRIRPGDIIGSENIEAHSFFSHYVDLSLPFKCMEWCKKIPTLSNRLSMDHLAKLSSLEVLYYLQDIYFGDAITGDICADLPSTAPRIFSVASSSAASSCVEQNHVDLLLKVHTSGRFSKRFLQQAEPGEKMRFTVARSDVGQLIFSQPAGAPLVVLTTGAGIAPLRSLLQRRVAISTNDYERSMCLFAGFKPSDESTVKEAIRQAERNRVFDICELVVSNAGKQRPQDKILEPDTRKKLQKHLEHPDCMVFVCASSAAFESTKNNLSSIVGRDIRLLLGERYIEEVFKY